jgi:DNA invertase Pin-like site-specific DNA recombinase
MERENYDCWGDYHGKGQIDGDGFPRQRAAIERYAENNGYQITQWFEEKGLCGATEWETRPAWLEMIQSLNGNRTIFVEKLDRLARDLMVQEHIIADLKQRRITLVSVAEPDLCVDDPTRKLLRQIMGAIAEYDRTMIVLKLRAARKRKKLTTGRCEGRKLYGERDGEQSIIDEIRSMRAQNMIIGDIADNLNQRGVPTRYPSGRWHPTMISRILKRSARSVNALLGRRTEA